MYYLPCTRDSTVLHALFYVSGKDLASPHHIFSPENPYHIFPLRNDFSCYLKNINSGTTYQEVFSSKRNLRGISHFSFLIIANTFNTVDLDINEHYNRL